MGLEEDGVDLLEVDDIGAVTNGLDHGANAEVFDGPEGAFGTSGDEVDGLFGKGGVGKPDAFKLAVDVAGEVLGGEGLEIGAVCDAGLEVLVWPKLQGGVEQWLTDQDEVVVLGKVFEEKAELSKCFDGDEV